MIELHQMKCKVCESGDAQLSDEEIQNYLTQVNQWQSIEENGIKRLRRSFSFKDFSSALDYTNQVGKIAEEEGHHPSILTEWGKTTVTWWTHKINGLHLNDFIMASKTDEKYNEIAQVINYQ